MIAAGGLGYNPRMADPILLPLLIANSVVNLISEIPVAPNPVQDGSWIRAFPPELGRGDMTPAGLGLVDINGTTVRLAANIIIRNEKNMIMLPASLSGTRQVRYQLDAYGNLARAWIMTAAEIAIANGY